jgi:type I restriction enzyme R subunit
MESRTGLVIPRRKSKDREACALYKEAIDKHLPREFSEVIISTQGKKDSERLSRCALTKEGERAMPAPLDPPIRDTL